MLQPIFQGLISRREYSVYNSASELLRELAPFEGLGAIFFYPPRRFPSIELASFPLFFPKGARALISFLIGID